MIGPNPNRSFQNDPNKKEHIDGRLRERSVDETRRDL